MFSWRQFSKGVACLAVFCKGLKIALLEDAVAQSNESGAISNRNLLDENSKQRGCATWFQ